MQKDAPEREAARLPGDGDRGRVARRGGTPVRRRVRTDDRHRGEGARRHVTRRDAHGCGSRCHHSHRCEGAIMKAVTLATGLIFLACTQPLAAAEPDQPAPVAPAPALQDRLLLSGNGEWLTGGSGGGGGSALWSHTFAPRDVLNLGAEYQTIANSHWTNGILSGSFGLGSATSASAVYFEAHEGAGDVAQSAFDYSVIDRKSVV